MFIRTAAGTVLHTGDFKMDQLPLDGRITDLRAFARLGEEGVDLFMADSTNADVPGFTTAEKEIGPVLERLFGQVGEAHHRRLLLLAHPPRPAGARRRGAPTGARSRFVGRSMVRNMAHRREARLPARARRTSWWT